MKNEYPAPEPQKDIAVVEPELDQATEETEAANAEQAVEDVVDDEVAPAADKQNADMEAAEAVADPVEPEQEQVVAPGTAEPGIEDDEFIIKTVLSFIDINPEEINMRFDTDNHGGNLEFAEGRTVSKVEDDAPSICVFGQPISAEEHTQCDLQVQWKASASEEGGFYMGYLTKPKEAIRYWSAELGSILCLDSVGYYVYGGCGYFRELREGNCHEIGYRAPTNLKAGDTFRMIVDFSKDTVTLRHNGKMAAICPLYGHKEITLAFSFGQQGEEIEVLSCDLK